jgi:hypothetical protein
MLFRWPGKELLSGGHISPFAQEEFDGSTLPIDGAIEVDPLATNLDISLIYAPGIADRRAYGSSASQIPGHTAAPTAKWSYGLRRRRRSAIICYEIAGAEFKRQIPPDAQDDYFLVKVPPFEEILCRGRFRHPSRYRKTPSSSTVCTRIHSIGRTSASTIGDRHQGLSGQVVHERLQVDVLVFRFNCRLQLNRRPEMGISPSESTI